MATGIDEELDQDQQQYSDLPKGATVVTPPASGSTSSYSDLPRGSSVAGSSSAPTPKPVSAGGKGKALIMGPGGPIFTDVEPGKEAENEQAGREGNAKGGTVGSAMLAVPAGIAAPAATIGGLIGGYGGGKLAKSVTGMAGGDEDMQSLAEMGGNLFGGAAGGVAGDALSEGGLTSLARNTLGRAFRSPKTNNPDWGLIGGVVPRPIREMITPDNPEALESIAAKKNLATQKANQSIVKANDAAEVENAERDFTPFKPNPKTAELIRSVPSSGSRGGSVTGRGLSGAGNDSPFMQRQAALRNAADESKIQSPTSVAPPTKVTYQSLPREELYQMAKRGDVEAIKELERHDKGLGLPPNANFLIEPGSQRIPWRNLEK